MDDEKFGPRVRRVRLARRLGLRETAERVGISAAYLSRLETQEEKSPPAERVITALARVLDDDFDTLMQLAGRIPSELAEYVTTNPGIPAFLRTARENRLTGPELSALLEQGMRGGRAC